MEFNPLVSAVEATDYKAGTLARIQDALVLGGQAAAISGIHSIANSFLFKEHEYNTEQVLRDYDSRVGDYYAEHKENIDLVGFGVTALIPGSIGIKGLQMARNGSALGSFGRALNLPVAKKNQYMEAAMKELAKEGGTVPSLLKSATRRKQLTWETADQLMLNGAAEAVVVATMNDSSIFDQWTVKDFAWNMALGTTIGGAIGSALGGFAAKGTLNKLQDQIESVLRNSDVVNTQQNTTMLTGTKLAGMTTDILNLSTMPATLEFAGKRLVLDDLIVRTKNAAERTAVNKIKLQFNELSGGDEIAGQAYFDLIWNRIDGLRAAGKGPDEIGQELHGLLANVGSVSRLDTTLLAQDAKRFYLVRNPEGNTPHEKLLNMITGKRSDKTSKTAYQFADDMTLEDIAKVGKMRSYDPFQYLSLKDFYKANKDVDLVRMPDGSLRVHPDSKLIKRTAGEGYTAYRFVHLETRTISNEVIPTFGDIAGKNFGHTPKSIAAGGEVFNQTPFAKTALNVEPRIGSARWAWASKLTPDQLFKIAGKEFSTDDLPMVTRLQEISKQLPDHVKANDIVIHHNGIKYNLVDGELPKLIDEKRRDLLMMGNGTGGHDVRTVAANLNTTAGWVENAIAGVWKEEGILPTAAAMQPRSLRVTWDFTKVATKLENPEDLYALNMGANNVIPAKLKVHTQQMVAKQQGISAGRAAIGADMDKLPTAEEFAASARNASSGGSGPTALGASNADYGDVLGLWAQNSGKQLALLTQNAKDAFVESMASRINALRTTLTADGKQAAGAEFSLVTTKLRSLEHRMVLGSLQDRVLYSEQVFAKLKAGDGTLEEILAEVGGRMEDHVIKFKYQESFDAMLDFAKQNDTMRGKEMVLAAAMGRSTTKGAGDMIFYAPPINTTKYGHIAFVKVKQKVGLATDDVGILTAATEDQLRKQVALLGDDFDVFYKKDTADYFKAKGQYDYQLSMNESRVNSMMHRRGKLFDAQPETRVENTLEDWLEHSFRQIDKVYRNAVIASNRTLFNELEFLSENYKKTSESVVRSIGSRFSSKIADPFGDYIKTSLNMSKLGELPLLDALNNTVNKVSLTAGEAISRMFLSAEKKLISWEDANKGLKELGLNSAFSGPEAYFEANLKYPRNIVRDAFSRGNMWLANLTLRLDFANSLVNILSTPIMLSTEVARIKELVAKNPELAGAFKELTHVVGPNGVAVASPAKLMAAGINNYFSKDYKVLFDRYRGIGAIKDVARLHREVLDDMAFNVNATPDGMAAKLNAAVDKGAKITMNQFAEDFTRFISADVMRQMTQPLVAAGKISEKIQDAYISTFVNKVQGNYVTSQRPILFQDTVGASVSLFQTYAFNVLQQLHRNLQHGNKRAVATFGALQTSIFGLNGLPFFDAVNQHIIGSWMAGNPQHKDAYSVLPGFNKDLGDWLLYGTPSAFPLFTGSMPAIYTRGDINPRHPTIIPIDPRDVPAVQAAGKLLDTVVTFGKSIGGGVDVSTALLDGVAHQSLNRPLAGFAQLVAGRTTTSKGSLIAASNDMETTGLLAGVADRVTNFGGVARMMGSRPMDEAVALNNYYRQLQYKALDTQRIERLGHQVKLRLQNGEVPSDEELETFMTKYARTGGRIENFSEFMQRSYRDVNNSVVNRMADKLNTPYGREMKIIMGGVDLEDSTTEPVPE